MDIALLYLRLRIHSFYSRWESGESVCTGYEYILSSTVPESVQYAYPELCVFILPTHIPEKSQTPTILMPIVIYTAFFKICPSLRT